MMEWKSMEREAPPFNKLVLTYMVGSSTSLGTGWKREVFAFMVRRKNGEPRSLQLANGCWDEELYCRALIDAGAGELMVTHWMEFEKPEEVE